MLLLILYSSKASFSYWSRQMNGIRVSGWLVSCSYSHFITSCHQQASLFFLPFPHCSFFTLSPYTFSFSILILLPPYCRTQASGLGLQVLLLGPPHSMRGEDRLTSPVLLHLKDHRLLCEFWKVSGPYSTRALNDFSMAVKTVQFSKVA